MTARLVMGIFAFSTFFPGTLFAQERIDQLEGRFDERVAPRSEPGPSLPAFDPLSPPPAAAAFTFRLRAVRLVGNSVFVTDVLKAEYDDLLGRSVSVADIFAIANRLTSYYGNHGYPLSRAIVPAQEIGSDGLITIQIVEGYADTVPVEGAAANNPIVQGHARKIAGERPLSSKTLERELLLADDLPGLKVKSVLKKSDVGLGATTVILDTQRDKPFEYSVTLDNRGSDAVGPWQLDLKATANNLLQENSATSVRLVSASLSNEFLFATLEHEVVLNSEGTRLRFGLKASNSVPGTEIFDDIELRTDAQTVFMELSHPFIRSRNANLYGHVLFEGRNSQAEALGAPLFKDKLRSLRFGLDFDNSDAFGGLNTVSAELSKGLRGLGANSNEDPLNSREFGKVDYAKLTVEAARIQDLSEASSSLTGWSLRGAAFGQFTSDALMSSEECSLGGEDFGRAFDSSALSGDRCFAASLELRYQAKQTGIFDALQYYSFIDGARVSNLDDNASGNWDSLSSAGLGARFNFNEHYIGSIEVAKQLRISTGEKDHNSPRLFVSLTGEF